MQWPRSPIGRGFLLGSGSLSGGRLQNLANHHDIKKRGAPGGREPLARTAPGNPSYGFGVAVVNGSAGMTVFTRIAVGASKPVAAFMATASSWSTPSPLTPTPPISTPFL